jgi:hypothetical protein
MVEFAAVTLIFGTPIALVWMVLRYRLQSKELGIQKLVEERKLMEAKRLVALPDFVDADDPSAVAAWVRARRELAS